MYMVYWTEYDDGGEGGHAVAHGRSFGSEEMGAALKFMEELRARQRDGERICFVAMSSENPDSVGKPGVADPSPDYDWKKRRR
ncbi:hypothetical protein [Noviherbaspirillum galbum]|uniref:Uncharacterized protein n=1 Tax=Noviherbaspirillum galbum TaxID=2709383 RepID=A0A6B3SS97_9BURK|nr:hypothetical protein [Noviherbaspirillum galbum]NEX63564.1 hypothetical protein [Noviherbaspirillum galbum]